MIVLGLIPFLTLISVDGHVPVSPPIIKTSPTQYQSEEKTTITLPCEIKNLGGNIVRWWKGEILLYDSNDLGLIPPNRNRIWANNSLQLSHLAKNDSGEYVCQIVRPEPWTPIQITHTVQVLYPPQVFPVPGDGKIVSSLGEDVEMGCLATGMPPPTVTWIFKNAVLGPGDSQHRLRFKAGDRLMTGTYQCQAENGIGPSAEAEINLRIKYKPEVSVDQSIIHASPGLRVEIRCTVSGDPEPKITWLFEGAPLEYADFGQGRVLNQARDDGRELTFRNLRPSDFGVYICRGENSEGITEAPVELTGVPQRAAFKKLVNRTNTSVSLVWEVDSYTPIIEYSLSFRNLQPGADDTEWVRVIVPADDGHSPGPIHSKAFTIHGLQARTLYQALVSSRNRYGWSEPSRLFNFGTEGSQNIIEVEPEHTTIVERPTLSPELQLQVAIELNRIINEGNHSANINSCLLLVLTCHVVLSIVNKL